MQRFQHVSIPIGKNLNIKRKNAKDQSGDDVRVFVVFCVVRQANTYFDTIFKVYIERFLQNP